VGQVSIILVQEPLAINTTAHADIPREFCRLFDTING